KHPDPKVRYQSAELLRGLGPVAKFAIPALREALKDNDTRVRVKAAEALWTVEKPAPNVVLPVLVAALQEKDADLRVSALMVLGRLGRSARTAVPVITDMLKDKDLGVRLEAILTLGEVGPGAKAAVPALLDVLQGEDVQLIEPLVSVTLGNIGAGAVPA